MKKVLKLNTLILFLVSLFLITQNIFASEYLSDKTETTYSTLNGLPTGKANSITQTEDGYIWIGQYAGLTKYNGSEFSTITSLNDYDLTGVVVLESYKNKLLVGTQKSFYIYENNNISNYTFGLDSEFRVKNISVYENNAYIATNKGLFLLDLDAKTSNKIVDNSLDEVSTYKNNTYYIVNKQLYNANDVNTPVKEFEDVIVTSVYSNEDLYVGTQDGFYINNKSTFVPSNASSFNINSFLLDNENLYLGCDDALYIYNINSKKLEKVKNLTITNSIEKVLKDYEGNIWLASSKQGIEKITQNILLDYFFEYSVSSHFSFEKSVNGFIKYKGLDYIATDTGLIIIDQNKSGDEAFVLNELTEALDNVRLRAVAIYNDKLYFATYNASHFDLVEYDGTNYKNYDLADYTVSSSNASDVRCLCSANDELYIGTKSEIIRFDGTNFISMNSEASPLYIYCANNVLYVSLDNVGPAYVSASFASDSTLTRIDPNSTHAILKTYYYDNKLLFNDNNNLYYYENGSINKLNYQLEGSIVEILYLKNKWYIGTDTKIYVYDDIFTNSNQKIIDISNGLKGNLVANSSGYYDSSLEQYYFVANNGVYVYDLNKEIVQTNVKPKIVISKISANGKSISIEDCLNLESRTQRLTIGFDVLTYKVNPEYEIYYMLEGVDNQYRVIKHSDANEISYTNLSGGDYKFSIYVKSGELTSDIISFDISKNKRFFEVPGFWITIGIIAIVFLTSINVLYIKHRTKVMLKRQNEYREITLESIEAIARTIDAKDHYTNGHSLRVGYFSREIAKAMGLSDHEVENIYYSALLHDIGKIAVPDKILNKPGNLTDDEYCVIQTHTIEGSTILSSITTIPNITLGAKYHHERYDGTGYPEGLKGEEIPLVARIICCADCYDAMATKRVYKEPYLTNHIIEEFVRCAGTQFDPEIANIVIKLINEKKIYPDLDTSIESIKEKDLKNGS